MSALVWTPERNALLTEMRRRGKAFHACLTALNDLPGAHIRDAICVRKQAARMGLPGLGISAAENGWAPEAVATLRRMWAEGATAATIGAHLGVSHYAVMGKADRLGLPGRATPIQRQWTPERAALAHEMHRRCNTLREIFAAVRVMDGASIRSVESVRVFLSPPAPVAVAAPKVAPRRTLGGCEWVACGAPAVEACWCAEHVERGRRMAA